MKAAITGATALFLYCLFFFAVLGVAAYRAVNGQPSPFDTEEDSND